MFDSHAHLCFPDFKGEQEEIIASAREHLKGVMVSSARFQESIDVLDLVKKYPNFLHASIGHHPIEGNELEKTIALIRDQIKNISAIGEVGLDRHWVKDEQKIKQQKNVFKTFIALSKEVKRPLVIHSWDAEAEAFELIKDAGVRAAFHCYTGPKNLALEIADAGFFVSISTAVLFSKTVKKTAKAIPLDKILLETDSPFLDPDRTRKRNVPENILLSAKKIAELRSVSQEEVLKAAWENAKTLFMMRP